MAETRDSMDEGVYVAPKDTADMIKRYNTLDSRKKKIEAEMNQIKESLKEEMEAMSVLKYVDDHGIVKVTRYKGNRSTFDKQTATEILGAVAVEKFYTKTEYEGLRFSR